MQSTPLRLATCLAAGILAGPAAAQDYPDQTVTLVVPFGAGGGTDTMARVVAGGLQETLGEAVVVDNKPGASGNIGMAHVARAAADGYTLLMVTNNIVINPLVYDEVHFDPVADFAPIALIGSSPVAISVHDNLGVNNLAELIDYARANPGELSYTTCGAGAPQHLAAELLSQMAEIEMVHIPYKGCAPSIPDHLSGEVPVSFSTIANLAPHAKDGNIQMIALTGAERSAYAPDIPTVSEAANLPDYAIDVWFGMYAPAGTPDAVVHKLNEVVNQQLGSEGIREKMAAQNYDILGGTPEDLAEKMRDDNARYSRVIEAANITAN